MRTLASAVSGRALAAAAALAVAVGAPPAPAGEDGGGQGPEKRLTAEITASDLPGLIERDFGTVRAGVLLVLDVAVRNDTATPLEIARVVPKCACMEAEADGRTVAPGATGHITVTLESDEYSGPVRESALVLWQDRAMAVTTVEVVTTVEPLVEVLPRRLVRFSVDSGEGAVAEVELRSADGAAFRITGAECSQPYLRASARGEGASHLVTVELAEDAPPGMLRDTVTIATDLPGAPTVELKITGVVRKPKAP